MLSRAHCTHLLENLQEKQPQLQAVRAEADRESSTASAYKGGYFDLSQYGFETEEPVVTLKFAP